MRLWVASGTQCVTVTYGSMDKAVGRDQVSVGLDYSQGRVEFA